jgi:hypothetical protein
MRYFDFKGAAREAGLSAAQVRALCKRIREDFPSDTMMFELHVLRACLAIRDRRITVEEALSAEPVRRKTR